MNGTTYARPSITQYNSLTATLAASHLTVNFNVSARLANAAKNQKKVRLDQTRFRQLVNGISVVDVNVSAII